ncbi:hypothetical protein RCCS2_11437 [Roseobacter sp. CCS2]|nr:hypothetical protein RCCS2_11437 [Roseobacter sp. CCS2]
MIQPLAYLMFCLIFSLWGAGYKLGKGARWVPPRLIIFTRFLSITERAFHRSLNDRSFLSLHKNRKTISYRFYAWALSLSDHSKLDDQQKIERGMWMQSVIISAVGIILLPILQFYFEF